MNFITRWIDARIQKALTKSTPEGTAFKDLMDLSEASRYSIFADGVNAHISRIYALFKSTCDAFQGTIEAQGAKIIELENKVIMLEEQVNGGKVEPGSGTGTVGGNLLT